MVSLRRSSTYRLTDYLEDATKLTIPVLLAASAIHQYLVRIGLRTEASIVVHSAEVREVHHFAALISFGVDAIHPYLAYATLAEAIEKGHLNVPFEKALQKFRKGAAEGVVKVMLRPPVSFSA